MHTCVVTDEEEDGPTSTDGETRRTTASGEMLTTIGTITASDGGEVAVTTSTMGEPKCTTYYCTVV